MRLLHLQSMKPIQLPSWKLGVFLTAWQLAVMVDVNAHADQIPKKPQPPAMITSSQLSPPLTAWFMQADTNFDLLSTNKEEFKIGGTPDAMEIGVLNRIKEIKSNLLQSKTDPNSRGMLEHLLKELRGELADHRALVQSNQAFAEAIRSNPRTAWTNMPDPIEQFLSLDVKRNERMLADSALDPNTRKMFERMLEDSRQKLADHKTNAQLWVNLNLARQSKFVEQTARAEKELADYLAANLGKIQGKKYPQGMSLDAIMKEYRKQENGSHWFDGRTAIRMIIFTFVLLLPLVMIFMAIKKRNRSRVRRDGAEKNLC